jgi:hypothetical protein
MSTTIHVLFPYDFGAKTNVVYKYRILNNISKSDEEKQPYRH